MFSINRLKKRIAKNRPKTITVDIFDTVLLRKTYPEELQFIEHAKNIQTLLKNSFGKQIDPMHWLSLRISCRQIIDDEKERRKQDREANIEEIFSLVITSLEEQLNTFLDQKERDLLIKDCIQEELELEKKKLSINKPLIKILRRVRSTGTPLFFISDIYLSKQHIQELLGHFDIGDLFTDGVCSSDQNYNKGSYRLYKVINKKEIFPVNWLHNLHIGDNPTSDGISARRAGSMSFILHQKHHLITRPFKKVFGKMKLKRKVWRYKRKLNKKFIQKKKHSFSSFGKHERILAQSAYTLGPALLCFLQHINLSSQYSKAPLCFLSSEGPSFELLLKRINSRADIRQLPSFNRINTLRSFAYLSLTKPLIKYSPAIIELFFHGEGKHTLKDLLVSLGIKAHELGLSELSLHQMPAKKFIKRLIKLLKKKDTVSLEKSYIKLTEELISNHILEEKHLILADVGWNGTIQILLEQIIQLLGKKNTTQGLYLGSTGHNIFGLKARKNIKGIIYPHLQHRLFQKGLVEEIWEYLLTSKESSPQIKALQLGLNTFIDHYKADPSAAPAWIHQATQKHLMKLFSSPTRDQALLLGSLQHDAGFGIQKKRAIVDLHYTQIQVLKMLIRKPDQLKNLYLKQYWPQGFLKWYRIQHLQPIINGLKWLKSKNLEIFG